MRSGDAVNRDVAKNKDPDVNQDPDHQIPKCSTICPIFPVHHHPADETDPVTHHRREEILPDRDPRLLTDWVPRSLLSQDLDLVKCQESGEDLEAKKGNY